MKHDATFGDIIVDRKWKDGNREQTVSENKRSTNKEIKPHKQRSKPN